MPAIDEIVRFLVKELFAHYVAYIIIAAVSVVLSTLLFGRGYKARIAKLERNQRRLRKNMKKIIKKELREILPPEKSDDLANRIDRHLYAEFKFDVSQPTVTLTLPPWSKPCLRIRSMWKHWRIGN